MDFEVIIIGGSYAGLSAGLALGRAKRNVLIIDAGKPCNKQTPQSHNFLTHDGDKPAEISAKAKAEVLKYPTVKFLNALATSAKKTHEGFEVETDSQEVFRGRKILLAAGLKDVMPDISGFDECWAISIIHCPYCHGYEVKDTKIALLMNGDMAFEMAKLISHWNKDLTILTNGKSEINDEHLNLLKAKSINVIDAEIEEFIHTDGYVKTVIFKDGSDLDVMAIYARPKMVQHSNIYQDLGCELDENGIIKVDGFQKTAIEGVYAAGDCATLVRGLSVVTAAGTMAGVMLNKDMIWEDF
ncbi:NAD(P)/FAD-dependent oxidoreductase [Pedobacter aquatilis]|uniref:NAD(P)/FAD-dependent oxidoreductase n=1 Tax=Pedobacter aquatilis TaxID=351343 RepID=UPI00292EA9F2|nr:NAD(P)/FAD-dependent oxidoreductase [Pedobacter aquatilis]